MNIYFIFYFSSCIFTWIFLSCKYLCNNFSYFMKTHWIRMLLFDKWVYSIVRVWEQAISFGMLPNTRPEFNFAYVFDFLDMQIFCLKIVPFYDSKLKTVSNYKTAFSLFPRQSFDILSLERTFYFNHLFKKKAYSLGICCLVMIYFAFFLVFSQCSSYKPILSVWLCIWCRICMVQHELCWCM